MQLMGQIVIPKMNYIRRWVIPMLAAYHLNLLFLGLLFIAIALPPSIWIYWRFLKRKTDISKGRRARLLIAIAALTIWLTNSVVPICYGDGKTWDIRLESGYILYHHGVICTWASMKNVYFYHYAHGFAFSHQDFGFDTLMPNDNSLAVSAVSLVPFFKVYAGRNSSVVGLAFHIPLWPFLGIPIAAFIVEEFRYRRRARTGKCLECGYDLRGSASTCPECGRKF